MSAQVVETIRALPETRRFMKGIFAWAGYRTATVEYVRAVRVAGSSKFSAWKLWNFALEGVTGFGTLPLRLWTYLGLTVAVLAFCYALFLVVRTLVLGIAVPGYASTLVAILFLGGVQLIGIGVLGEYVGRTYLESKRRPIYAIRSLYGIGMGASSKLNADSKRIELNSQGKE